MSKPILNPNKLPNKGNCKGKNFDKKTNTYCATGRIMAAVEDMTFKQAFDFIEDQCLKACPAIMKDLDGNLRRNPEYTLEEAKSIAPDWFFKWNDAIDLNNAGDFETANALALEAIIESGMFQVIGGIKEPASSLKTAKKLL